MNSADLSRAYVSWGSNLGDSESLVADAIDRLIAVDGIYEVTCSPAYRSKAIGPGEQRDYHNGVVEVKTSLTPKSLLEALHSIEASLGRERIVRWGARTVDLDLLDYEGFSSDATELLVPHPRAHIRNFVIYPWADIAPEWQLHSRSISQWRKETPDEDLSLWQDT